ncbi:MAG: VWA domain-containing protein, partial [Chloroflexota bacterium]
MIQKGKNILGALIVTTCFLLVNTLSASNTKQDVLPPLKVVQLGDSYSAGNGARGEDGKRNYHSVSGCYRSPTNWGSQFVESLSEIFSVTYVNRACSGGIIADITNTRDMKDADFKNVDGSCPDVEYPDEEFYLNTSTLKCSRFVWPQITAVDESVDLVLMTGGGNDVKFATIVQKCFVEGAHDVAQCRDAVKNAEKILNGQVENRLLTAFRAIKSKNDDIKIAFITYPHLIENLGIVIQQKNLLGNVVDSYEVGDEIRRIGREGDKVQRRAIERANSEAGEEYIVFFDETKNLFSGHLPSPADIPSNPDRWLYEPYESYTYPEVEWVEIAAEWYHYNPAGHQNLADALSLFKSFGATGGSFESDSNIDVAFVVDTTGSMGNEIAQVKEDLSQLVNQLATTTNSYRVAVVSYRDFPERTGDPKDYPFRVDQGFTNDLSSIQSAIDSLTAEGGDDWNETVFSGIQAAIELPWRPGVTKMAVVIGDAPAHSPEPISGLTAGEIVANSIAVDPVQVIGLNVESLDFNGALTQITEGTGGSIVPSSSDLTNTISEILGSAAKQPFAWIGTAYSGEIGSPIQFSANGSYDPSGLPISLYEWDFDGDGTFDFESTQPNASHIYDSEFNNFVIMRVTSGGGTALASARTIVNKEGYVSQGDEAACEINDSGDYILVDEDGQFIRCTIDSPPDSDNISSILGGPDIVYIPIVKHLSSVELQSPAGETPTNTPVPPTPTHTPSPLPTVTNTPSPTPSNTPTLTPTPTNTLTFTPTPSPTSTPVTPVGPQWQTVDTFSGLSNGTIDGKNGWDSTGGAKVALDPVNSGNKVLVLDEFETRGYKSLPSQITNSSTGTLFFRLRRDGNVDGFGGMADVTVPDAWNDYETQFGSQSQTTPLFTVRDSSNFRTSSGEYSEDTWYCIWMVADNINNDYNVYVKGGQYTSKTRVTAGGFNTFDFRNGGSDSLKTFFARTGNNFTGRMLIDDIYIDANN